MQPVQTWVTQYNKPASGLNAVGQILGSYYEGQRKRGQEQDLKRQQALIILSNMLALPYDQRLQVKPIWDANYESVYPGGSQALSSLSPTEKFKMDTEEQARAGINQMQQPTVEQPIVSLRDMGQTGRTAPRQGQSQSLLQPQKPQQPIPSMQNRVPPQIPGALIGSGNYNPITPPSGDVRIPSTMPQIPPLSQQQQEALPGSLISQPQQQRGQETVSRVPGAKTITPGLTRAEIAFRKPYTYKTAMGLQATPEDSAFEALSKEEQDISVARKAGTAMTMYQEEQIKQGNIQNSIAATKNIIDMTLSLMNYPEKVRKGLIPFVNKMLENLELSGVTGIRYITEEDFAGVPPEGMEAAKLKYKADLEASLLELKNPQKPMTYKEKTAQDIDVGESVFLAMIKGGASPKEARGAMWNAIQDPVSGVVPGDAIEQSAASKLGWQGKPNSCALGVNNALKSVGIDVAKKYGINPLWAPDYAKIGYSVSRDQLAAGDLVFLLDNGNPPQYHMGIAAKDGKNYYNVSSEENYKWSLKPIPENAEFRRIDAIDPVQAQIDKWRSMTTEQRKAIILASESPGASKLLGAPEGKPDYTPQQATQDLVTMKEKKFQLQKYWEAQQTEEIKENTRQNTAYQFANYLKKATKPQYENIYNTQIKGKRTPEQAAEYARKTTQTWIDAQIAEQKGIAPLLLEYGIDTTVSGIANLPDYTPKNIKKLPSIQYGKTADPEGYALWEEYDQQEKEALKYTPGYKSKTEKPTGAQPKPSQYDFAATQQYVDSVIAEDTILEALLDLENPVEIAKLKELRIDPSGAKTLLRKKQFEILSKQKTKPDNSYNHPIPKK